jgi:signal transduction histidine kinase
LFRNLRINIFIFYVVTTATFLSIFYYAVFILSIENIYIIALVLFLLVLLSAFFISKLSVDPLESYVKELQILSKETLHELNLPISTITNNVQMLKKGSNDEKTLRRLKRIEGASLMLKERYNELDYMIKMQSKEAPKEEFFLDELLRERVEFVKKIYPHIDFRLNVTKYKLFSDKIGFSKVIDNLIDNSVKYSGESKVVEIYNNEEFFYIRDYGIGMSEVELLKIFDAYYQTNRQMQGFGIGLSMVKRFCDQNNIELSFDSAPNAGTTVKLKFNK